MIRTNGAALLQSWDWKPKLFSEDMESWKEHYPLHNKSSLQIYNIMTFRESTSKRRSGKLPSLKCGLKRQTPLRRGGRECWLT